MDSLHTVTLLSFCKHTSDESVIPHKMYQIILVSCGLFCFFMENGTC